MWLAAYAWNIFQFEAGEKEGVTICKFSEKNIELANTNYFVWTLLYLFIPAFLLLVLNIAILIRLRRVHRLHKKLTQSQPLRASRILPRKLDETSTDLSTNPSHSCVSESKSKNTSSTLSSGSATVTDYSWRNKYNSVAKSSNKYSIR